MKSILRSNMLCTIHNALIMPHFNDSHLAWGSNTKTGLGWTCYINRHEQVLMAAIKLPILNQSVKKTPVVKPTDMFRILTWKFYYKLSNNFLITLII